MKKLVLAALAALSLTAGVASATPAPTTQHSQGNASSNMLPGDYGLNGGGG